MREFYSHYIGNAVGCGSIAFGGKEVGVGEGGGGLVWVALC